jgi:hypothetical protein
MQPTIASQYSDTWHAAEDDQERAWLDDWMRGRVCTHSLEVCPALEPAPESARPLATTRSY